MLGRSVLSAVGMGAGSLYRDHPEELVRRRCASNMYRPTASFHYPVPGVESDPKPPTSECTEDYFPSRTQHPDGNAGRTDGNPQTSGTQNRGMSY